ncbi:uncharacterized protein LOC106081808 [Stomoxys calcitrans]|uniref:uncharacterized protein LOC106081808 n=1 Tax=Stomoxys calcitrans TaxID=35570 RepID=UPI0027E23966|nr:uncharacterized protein LOC106081808 [Stomoxys calcitrans]
MRSFIVLCLLAVACAEEGYNYPPAGHSGGAAAAASYAPAAGHSGGAGAAPYAPASGPAGVSGYAGNNGGVNYNAPSSSYSAPAEVQKEFYTFTAPENEFDDANAAQRLAGSIKQGLRVIFIKGPENKGLEDAALALAKQAAQQKTAIYVLNKQADIGDLANKLNSISSSGNNKPEVHFVKYRTAADAVNAQRTIQDQYNSLGGNSHNINGGVAPVLNFASQAPVRAGAAPQAPQNTYLPSTVLRSRS